MSRRAAPAHAESRTEPRNEAPHPPQRSRVIEGSPVYYGWVILAVAALGMIMTTPGQTVGVSVFLDRIIADLDASRTLVSGLYLVGTLAGSFALPLVGRFIDRRGPRLAVILIAAGFAFACAFMGQVRNVAMLALGFVLIRGLGQGSLGLVSIHVINLWFVRRRGLAVGVAGVAFAVASGLFAGELIEPVAAALGWRGAYTLLGGLVAVTILPLGALLFRGHPERFGLRPDSGRARPDAAPLRESNATLGEAVRSSAFWIILAGDVCVAALSTGLIFHHFDIVGAGGLERADAASALVAFGFVSAGATLLTGLLFDQTPPRFLLALMLAAQAGALAVAGLLSAPLLLAYVALLGVTQGARGALAGAIYAHYFGRAAIGSIKGFTATATVAGTAAGPLLFALGQQLSGSYRAVLLASAALPLVLAAASLFLRPPAEAPAADAEAVSA